MKIEDDFECKFSDGALMVSGINMEFLDKRSGLNLSGGKGTISIRGKHRVHCEFSNGAKLKCDNGELESATADTIILESCDAARNIRFKGGTDIKTREPIREKSTSETEGHNGSHTLLNEELFSFYQGVLR